MKSKEEIQAFLDSLDDVQFLSPNEPMTPQGIQRVIDQVEDKIVDLEDILGTGEYTITLWNPNLQYNKDEIVLYFKTENKQITPEVGKREFAFVLVSTQSNNTSIPNYDMVDGIPDFTKSNWKLINPMSYLLQDLVGMKEVVKEVFQNLLDEHIQDEHGLIGAADIEKNLVKRDYSNLYTFWSNESNSLYKVDEDITGGHMKLSSNGIMEYQLKYSFDEKANQRIKIKDSRYYYQKSPIWDESDNTIFSQKYTEDELFSVNVNKTPYEERFVYTSFNNLRYGTNIFHKHIEFKQPFINDEYMVFFDTYGNGQFVFGYDKTDLQAQTEPTYDAVVSLPMLMNKTAEGFDIVLPIHCHFNSIQKYNVGVPWDNVFTLQAIGRYR